MRRLLLPVLTFLLLATAVGCASKEGIEMISVSGDLGEKPKVSFEKPFEAEETESKVIAGGDGGAIKKGQKVVIDYVGINGRDGKEFDSSWQRGVPASFVVQQGQLINGFVKGLVGKSVGDRVLLTIPPKDGYGDQGNQEAGIKGSDTLIFVVDVKDAYTPLRQAKGETVAPPDGLPTVKTDEEGRPTAVNVPKTDPPKDLVAQPLIRGNGSKVTPQSTIDVHYTGVNWRTGKVFESSWNAGAPVSFPMAGIAVAGLKEGLVGQTVGSRVLLVIPPDKGFGQDLPNTDLKKTDTVVFVIDILGPT